MVQVCQKHHRCTQVKLTMFKIWHQHASIMRNVNRVPSYSLDPQGRIMPSDLCIYGFHLHEEFLYS